MPTPRRLLLAAALALALPAAPARATQLLHQTLRDLTLSSSDIVIGQVETAAPRWNAAHTRIFTDVSVRVSQTLKGAPGSHLVLSQIGGELDGWRYDVEGVPLFRPGEQTLLFVWRDARGRAQVNGLSQGKFDIGSDPATGTPVVQRSVAGLEIREVRGLSLVRPGETAPRIPLQSLVGEIQSILQGAGR